MKVLITILIGVFSAQWALAGCTEGGVELIDAQATLGKLRAAYEQGEASKYDLLLAQKNLMEGKLCRDSRDYAAFEVLAENVVERIAITNAEIAEGSATQLDAVFLAAEAKALASVCTAISADAQDRFRLGEITRQDLDLIADACGKLQ